MDVKTFYEQMGVDYNNVLRRLCSEQLILKYLGKLPTDPTYRLLTDAFAAGDAETAFRAAHTLKGLCLNLDLRPLLEESDALTERLRAQTPLRELQGELDRLSEEYHRLTQRIEALLSGAETGESDHAGA